MSETYVHPKRLGGKAIKDMNSSERLHGAQNILEDINSIETTLKFLGEADTYIETLEQRIKALEGLLAEKDSKIKVILQDAGYIVVTAKEDLRDLRLDHGTSLRWCVLKIEDLIKEHADEKCVESDHPSSEANKPYDESVF